MNDYKITDIQLYDYAIKEEINNEGDIGANYSYSANIVINDEFVVQVSGDLKQATFDGVTHPTDCYWNDKEIQRKRWEEIESSELLEILEADGFENNIGWLEDNATDVMNPEFAKYRYDNLDTPER